MPSWKPDCLKASATLSQLSNTIHTARFLNADGMESQSSLNELKINHESDYTPNSNQIKLSKHQHHQNSKADVSKALSFQNASSKISILKGYSTVELIRLNGSQFGLTIAGGTDKDTGPRICDLKPGSIAHRSDELQIGDMIISINGIKTQGLKHEEIIDLIKNAGDNLVLEFEYNLPPWRNNLSIHPHHAVRSQTVHIQLEKENSSYGFTLRGGFNEEKQRSRPLIVTNIRAGGSADREGTLKIGDRIIAINGINVSNASLQEAYLIIKQCKGLTLFLVEYDSAIVDSIKNSNGPLLIEIEKSPGSSIGIKLTSAKNPNNGKNQILVEYVKPASIADRCGAIYVGDQILSIDDVSFEHVTLAEANQILKNCVGEFSRVEIVPLSQLVNSNKQANNKNNSKSLIDLNKEYRLVDMQKFGSIISCNNLLNTNQVSHPETVDINLIADENGTFGFTLQGSNASIVNSLLDNMQSIVTFPVIGYVEPNSSAERCGIMQPGDRIILVNNRSLEGLSLEEARQIIKESGNNLKLEIEFDVADGIMLSSGIFQVKLLKKNLDVGITVSYPKFGKSEYPCISMIKKGSVAYRSGMLLPGDRILYIDNVCLKHKSLEEINHLLRTSDEILKLKIKKFEENCEDDNSVSNKSIVYTVEMQRNGGPLGITISGSEDPYEPMFVSALSEGGLAERTSAIHIGDVLLAINNISLKGKSLKEAIHLLQNADDIVTLKISRKIDNDIYLEDLVDTSNKDMMYNNNNNNNNNNIINMNRDSNINTSLKKNFPNNNIHNVKLNEIQKNFECLNSIQTPSRQPNMTDDSIKNMPYLPFPMDLNYKKKTSSLDSINAVERELDEVLKDLELNSQDLNDQIEENSFKLNHNHHNVELPINLQKSHKQENFLLGSANRCKNNNFNNKPKNNFNEPSFSQLSFSPKTNNSNHLIISEFTQNPPDLFIGENISDEVNGKKSISLNNANDMRKRQNIVSTYELCNECFDNNIMMSGTDCNHHHQQHQIPMGSHEKGLTNKKTQHNSFNDNKNNFSRHNETDVPITIANNYSNNNSSNAKYLPHFNQKQDNNTPESTSPFYTKRSRSLLSQINESVIPDVTSNGKDDKRNIDKLDKLPPVPPSALSHNSSLRRRNQSYQSSQYNSQSLNQNKLKKMVLNNNSMPQNGRSSHGSPVDFQNNNMNKNLNLNNESDKSYNNSNNVRKENKQEQIEYELQIQEPISNQNGCKNFKESDLTIGESSNNKNYDNMGEDNERNIEEIVEITLSKDHKYKDFGFYIAQSVCGNGLFISKVRDSGPAENNSHVKKGKKIYKVNNFDFTKVDIHQANKILFNEYCSNNQMIKLTISKNINTNVKLNDEINLNNNEAKEKTFNNSSSSNTMLNGSNKPTAL